MELAVVKKKMSLLLLIILVIFTEKIMEVNVESVHINIHI